MGNIYVIKNKINNRCYVGKTHKSIDKRFKEHIYESRLDRSKHKPLYEDLNAFGKENFSIELIDVFDNNILEEKEIEYIKLYNSHIDKGGYNISFGGSGKTLYNFDESCVIKQYNEFKNLTEVSNIYGCDISTIKKILIKNNVEICKTLVLGIKNHNSKLTDEDVLYIKGNYIPRHKEFGTRAMARRFGVDHAVVSRILNNEKWKHVKFDNS